MIYLYAYLASVLLALIVYARFPRARLWNRTIPVGKEFWDEPGPFFLMLLAIATPPIVLVVMIISALWVPFDTGADDKNPDSGGAYR